MPNDEIDLSKVVWDKPMNNTGEKIDLSQVKWEKPNDMQQLRWADVPVAAMLNAPKSAGNFINGIIQTIKHPIDTASNVLDLGAGALRNTVPESLRNLIDTVDTPQQQIAAQRASKLASAVGNTYKDRYGGIENVKNTLATDPVGVASDLSALLTAGAAATSKVPALQAALKTGANYTNPLNVVKPALKLAGVAGKNILGLSTGTGPENISEAAKAGFERNSIFMDNMRGKVPMTDVLDDAKAAIQRMGQDRSAQYRAGMAQVSNNKTPLNFNGIDTALNDAKNVAQYHGKVISPRAMKAINDMELIIDDWKQSDPAKFHTPEGMDALKRAISGIQESIPFEEKQARLAAGKIYNSVKDNITKQFPDYARIMKDYSDATEIMTEIERALSLGKGASVDTGMRKLQSLMRNNVSTNYGNRLNLARELESKGNADLLAALAGQSMNSWTSRGLGGRIENLGTLGVGISHPPILATIPLQMPKFVGSTLYGGGAAAGVVNGLLQELGLSTPAMLTGGLLSSKAGGIEKEK